MQEYGPGDPVLEKTAMALYESAKAALSLPSSSEPPQLRELVQRLRSKSSGFASPEAAMEAAANEIERLSQPREITDGMVEVALAAHEQDLATQQSSKWAAMRAAIQAALGVKP